MTHICDLTGKTVMTGCRVSHANNKTRRRFLPNLHPARLYSNMLRRTCSLRVSSYGLRQINRYGGLDGYLLSQSKRHAKARFSARVHKLYRAVTAIQQAALSEAAPSDDQGQAESSS